MCVLTSARVSLSCAITIQQKVYCFMVVTLQERRCRLAKIWQFGWHMQFAIRVYWGGFWMDSKGEEIWVRQHNHYIATVWEHLHWVLLQNVLSVLFLRTAVNMAVQLGTIELDSATIPIARQWLCFTNCRSKFIRMSTCNGSQQIYLTITAAS